MEAIGLLESASERLLVDHLGEIKECPGDGGDRDRVDERPIRFVDPTLMDDNARSPPSRCRGDFDDTLGGARQSP